MAAAASVAASAAAASAAEAARQKCVTVVENRAGTLFGHIFAMRKVPKVCNHHQKIERAHSSSRFSRHEKCQKCVTVIKNRTGTLF